MRPWLAQRATATPDAPALSCAGRETCRELDWRGLAAAAALRASVLAAHGVARGDRVLVLTGGDSCNARLENALWIHAAWWRGGVVIPVSPKTPQGRLSTLVERLQAAAVVKPAGARPLPGHCTARFTTIPTDAARRNPGAAAIEAVELSPGDHAVILLTSGSTAAPRAVGLTFAQMSASAEAVAGRLEQRPADQWLACMPLEHIGGLAILVRSVTGGASVRLLERFDADEVGRELETRRITLASMVPTMLADLLAHRPHQFRTSLRALLIGGAAAAPGLLFEARARGLPVLPTWGMTEAGSQLATPTAAAAATADFHAKPGWAGPPLPGVEVRVGADSRLLVRGPALFSGYLDGEAPGPDADGWFATGDCGWIDARGDLHVTGRHDRMLISGGINVSLDAVETRLSASGLVREIALVALPDRRWGQRVGAIFIPSGHDRDSAARLRAWCREHLEPAEQPVRWRAVDRIPRSAAGKPLAPELRRLLIESAHD